MIEGEQRFKPELPRDVDELMKSFLPRLLRDLRDLQDQVTLLEDRVKELEEAV